MLPITAGIYTILALCAFCLLVLIKIDPTADYPDHPQFHYKTFIMLLNSICFIYLLAYLAAIYLSFILSMIF